MIPRSVLAIIGSWLIAHCIKYAIAASTQAARPNLRRQLFISGGMPSSHAAISWAVWVVVVMSDGIHSSAAGIATLVALIFCYARRGSRARPSLRSLISPVYRWQNHVLRAVIHRSKSVLALRSA